jgi:hypothetical protein
MYVILDEENYFRAQIFDSEIISTQSNVIEAPDQADINNFYKLVDGSWQYIPKSIIYVATEEQKAASVNGSATSY